MCEAGSCKHVNRNKNRCGKCGTVNPLVELQKVMRKPDDSWDCVKCSWSNNPHRTRCMMCGYGEDEIILGSCRQDVRTHNVSDSDLPPGFPRGLPRELPLTTNFGEFKRMSKEPKTRSEYKPIKEDIKEANIDRTLEREQYRAMIRAIPKEREYAGILDRTSLSLTTNSSTFITTECQPKIIPLDPEMELLVKRNVKNLQEIVEQHSKRSAWISEGTICYRCLFCDKCGDTLDVCGVCTKCSLTWGNHFTVT